MNTTPYFCHGCGHSVSARVNPTTNELECEMCHGSFVEVVEEATRGDLEGFLHPPPAPPQTAQGWANARDGVMGAEPEPHARDQSRRVDDIRRLLERSMQAVLTGQDDPLLMRSMGEGGGLFARGGLPLPTAGAAGMVGGGGGGGGGGQGGFARVAVGAPPAGSSATGERGLPPRVELFVNRGGQTGGTAGALLSILQPLLAGVAPTAGGGAATLGDYAVGDLNNIIELLMRNDPNRHGAPPAAAAAVEGLEVVKQTEETAAHECAVCKDMYSVGEEARRMPCEHVFHTACLTTWLKQHNSCPVCRYELPTDDPEYERHRASRQQQQQQGRAGMASSEEQHS